jgi:hypothetical protein
MDKPTKGMNGKDQELSSLCRTTNVHGNTMLDFQGVAKMGNTSVCRTTTELSGLVQMSKVSVKYNLFL